MSRNDLKQTIVHRSTEEKTLIERLIGDRVEAYRSTISGEAITAMKRGLLPSHADAAHQIELIYAGEKTINQAVASTFSIMGSGINWKAHYTNALPLVEYAASMNQRNGNMTRVDVHRDTIHDLRSSWDAIVVALKRYAHDDAHYNKANAEMDFMKAQNILEDITSHPADIRLNDAFDIILRNWNTLYEWQVTYTALACMCVVSTTWRQDATIRLELIDILIQMSRDWIIQDEERAKKRLLVSAERRMRQIPMLDAHLVAPEEWVILNPDAALYSRYAYVVTIKSNEYINKKLGPSPLPFFIYFSDSPVQCEIYDDCMTMATNAWPPLKAILTAHIDFPENYKENDQLVNEVINDSPNAAPFLIDDADKPYAHHPYGAMIVRHK